MSVRALPILKPSCNCSLLMSARLTLIHCHRAALRAIAHRSGTQKRLTGTLLWFVHEPQPQESYRYTCTDDLKALGTCCEKTAVSYCNVLISILPTAVYSRIHRCCTKCQQTARQQRNTCALHNAPPWRQLPRLAPFTLPTSVCSGAAAVKYGTPWPQELPQPICSSAGWCPRPSLIICCLQCSASQMLRADRA